VEGDTLSPEEMQICRSQGARLAMLAKKLCAPK